MGTREEMYRNKELEIKHGIIPIQTLKTIDKKLHMDLCVAQNSIGFSMCVEYATAWLMNGFANGFFKSINVSGNNIIRDFRDHDIHEMVRIQKPALAIIPELDRSFDRDGLDSNLNLYGTRMFTSRSAFASAFFKDLTKKLYLSLVMKLMLVKFTFKIKVSGKPLALDLADHCEMRFFSKATKSEYIDIDYLIPMQVMLRLARDVGFEVIGDKITNAEEFVGYINAHSISPFMYKYRAQKGHFEFYLKVPNQVIHTRVGEVQVDDGERDGQLDNNYIVSFDTEVRFPAPKYYAYFSADIHEKIASATYGGGFNIYEFTLCNIPAQNDKGWMQYVDWEWMEDDEIYKQKQPSTIELEEVLSGIDDGRFVQMIKDSIKSYMAPEAFLELKLYNDNKMQDCTVDWNTFTLKSKTVLTAQISHLVLYIDLRHKNEYEITKRKMLTQRVEQPEQYKDPKHS